MLKLSNFYNITIITDVRQAQLRAVKKTAEGKNPSQKQQLKGADLMM